MDFIANRGVIEAAVYEGKFEGLTSSAKGDKAVADYARKAVLDNDGLETEDVYFLNARSSKLIKHQKLGTLGGRVELPEGTDKLIVVHNHPNSGAVSFNDLLAFNNSPEIETMIAAAHDGTVYILNIGNGIRVDVSDEKEFAFFRNQWGRFKRSYGGIGAISIIAEKWGWNFYVR
jgi:hypothetical protein